ncbi:MAG: AbrB/MazE/SpoVT family DNA-binding domain-containing protein [Limisphaerales bacterium]
MKEMTVPIDQAGRMVLPKGVREEFAIKPGDTFRVSIHGASVTLTPNKEAGGFVREGKALVFSTGRDEILKRETVRCILEESRKERENEIAGGFRERKPTNWSVHSIYDNYGQVVSGNAFFAGLGSGSISTSTDGLNWAIVFFTRALIDLTDMTYGNGRFVVVGSVILYSDNIGAYCLLNSTWRPMRGFDLTVAGGEIGRSYDVQAITNVLGTNWLDILAYTNTSSITSFLDSESTNYPGRFYRVVSP